MENSKDLISRQAATQTALDFIVEYLGGAFDEDFQRKLIERMNALPSAQPDLPEWAQKVEHHLQNVPHYIVNPVRWALLQAYEEYDEKKVRE